MIRLALQVLRSAFHSRQALVLENAALRHQIQITAAVFHEGLTLLQRDRNAAWFADAVDFGWHHWVVGFTAERQKTLLESFGLRDLKGIGLAITLLIGSALAITLVYLIAQIPRTQTQDPLPALWQRLLHKLQRAGVQAPPWHGPDTICTTAIAAFPDASEQLLAINRMYVQMRYGRNQDRQQVKALRKRVDQLRLRHRADA